MKKLILLISTALGLLAIGYRTKIVPLKEQLTLIQQRQMLLASALRHQRRANLKVRALRFASNSSPVPRLIGQLDWLKIVMLSEELARQSSVKIITCERLAVAASSSSQFQTKLICQGMVQPLMQLLQHMLTNVQVPLELITLKLERKVNTFELTLLLNQGQPLPSRLSLSTLTEQCWLELFPDKMPHPTLQAWEVAELQLLGTLHNGNQSYAIVIDPSGLTHQVTIHDRLGNASIIKIDDCQVLTTKPNIYLKGPTCSTE